MKADGDRRFAGVNRVPLHTTVEMCGLDPRQAPAFEAESLDVSGRGLHLRTAFVPDLGTALVCRFEDRGREIIAEGTVAWTEPGARGGEFGMMFTALDSGSVDALRELTGLFDAATEDEEPEGDDSVEDEMELAAPAGDTREPTPPPPAPPPEPPRNDPGARVKLHIDGLGAPMKALVRHGTRSRVKVGSKLEFLKVGRRLEIENLERNGRRAACIDGVDVMLDPQSGVPQLVVALHYADLDDITPDPIVVDDDPRTQVAPDLRTGSEALATEESVAASDDDDLQDSTLYDDDGDYDEYSEPVGEDEVAEQAQVFQNQFTVAAQRAGALAQQTGTMLARFSGAAAAGVAKLARDAGARVGEMQGARAQKAVPRRQTAAPPQGVLSADGRRLRPQQQTARQEEKPPAKSGARGMPGAQLLRNKPVRRAALGIGLLAVATGLASFALRDPGAATATAEAAPAGGTPPAVSVASTPAATPVAATSDPVAAAQPRRLRDAPPQTKEGITANVPLFGPTPMATMEPAPLNPPTSEDDEAPAASKPSQVDDESFDDEIVRGDSSWGKGRLHLPTIYRIRLDGPGKMLKGSLSATGFSVVIPDRKTVENGDAIARGDERIARVATANGGEGARISFRFRDGVPPYRVRLRKDFVEFSISAPE